MIVLDTNVVSELMKPAPSAAVARWIADQPATTLYTTSITQAEILHGIMLLPAGKRRAALEAAAGAMFDEDFGGRVLPFGGEAARGYAQIAAIALSSSAAVATRNASDYEGCGINVLNPWDA